jgi:hypothetical protein
MAIYRDRSDSPWQVLDDYTFRVLAEFAKYSEAQKYAHDHGQSDMLISHDEYQQIAG